MLLRKPGKALASAVAWINVKYPYARVRASCQAKIAKPLRFGMPRSDKISVKRCSAQAVVVDRMLCLIVTLWIVASATAVDEGMNREDAPSSPSVSQRQGKGIKNCRHYNTSEVADR
jgi:hypothetical protein